MDYCERYRITVEDELNCGNTDACLKCERDDESNRFYKRKKMFFPPVYHLSGKTTPSFINYRKVGKL